VLAVQEVLHRGRTAHQEALVFRNPTFGTVLALDGVIQLTDHDNHIYHEMMAHVPLTAHGAAGDVLIIGGGDGGVLKEVLKHPVRRVVLVELDRDVIALSQRYFPAVSAGAFDDDRAEVVIGDGADHVARTHETFDVVIIDSTDPIGPGEALFSDSFYGDCRAVLRRGGMMVLQSGAPFYRSGELERARARLGRWVGAARPFLAPVPTYASGMLALLAAGPTAEGLCPPREVLQERATRLDGELRYYTPDVHHAAFVTASRLGGMTPPPGPSPHAWSAHP
jgi:spermidine synthase